jgi:hypothetical protein
MPWSKLRFQHEVRRVVPPTIQQCTGSALLCMHELFDECEGRLTIRTIVGQVALATTLAGRSRITAQDVTSAMPNLLHTAYGI